MNITALVAGPLLTLAPAAVALPAVQQTRLMPLNNGGLFGYSVSISGNTIALGSPGDSSASSGVNGNPTSGGAQASGSVTVFTRAGASWTRQCYLKASNAEANDNFGGALALSGDTLVVGAPGEDSAASGVNGDQASNGTMDSGAVYVFVRTGAVWTQQAFLKPSNTPFCNQFGGAVAIADDLLVVGAPGEIGNSTGVNGDQFTATSPFAGAVYVFRRTGGTWPQDAYIKASNTQTGDRFGRSVAVDGDTIVVGADSEDSNATGVNGDGLNNSMSAAGAAYVFVHDALGWSQQAYVKASNTGVNDRFGESASIAGDWMAIGASQEASAATGVNGNQIDNSAFGAGAVYVYSRLQGMWTQQAYVKASNAEANDHFGWSVALSGGRLLIGAKFESSSSTALDGNQASNGTPAAGAAYLFSVQGGAWVQDHYLKADAAHPTDQFGYSAGMDTDIAAIGAIEDASLGPVGAAHVFHLDTVSTSFCTGDPALTPCPCANTGSVGSGCANSSSADGAHLSSSGFAHTTADSLELLTVGVPDGPGMYFQGTSVAAAGAGFAFGDGLMCNGGTFVRMPVQFSVGGQIVYPTAAPNNIPVSVWCGIPASGGTYHYQWWYRDALSFCTPSTFNLSNGLTLAWSL